MLENWLSPLPPLKKLGFETLPTNSFGEKLALHLEKLPILKKTKIAIIGLAPDEANEIRKVLYPMSGIFPDLAIADLGNLRKPDPAFLIPVVHEMLSGKIIPILIGGKNELATAQFLAYHETKALVNLVAVDEKTRFGDAPDNFYNHLLSPRHSALFHYGLIGNQAHQSATDALEIIENQNFENIRLGKCRPSLEETEPVIRDADLFTFHLGALKMTEAPGVFDASPSGFFSEEACQICRYAGISDKLTSFGIYGFDKKLDPKNQTAQVVAQMIWYFLEGFFSRKNDFPASTDGLTEYIVDLPALNYQITFWKSTRSGRWWMQIPVETKRKHLRHRLVPCSYQDYQSAAVREELPDRLMKAFFRFS